MTNKTEITAFFGDQEYQFRLTLDLVVELERQAGAGIGTLSKRVFAGQFAIRDLIEIIRLGLIGGGLDPKRAKELTDTYCNRPVMEYAPIAIDVLCALMFGGNKPDNEATE